MTLENFFITHVCMCGHTCSSKVSIWGTVQSKVTHVETCVVERVQTLGIRADNHRLFYMKIPSDP